MQKSMEYAMPNSEILLILLLKGRRLCPDTLREA